MGCCCTPEHLHRLPEWAEVNRDETNEYETDIDEYKTSFYDIDLPEWICTSCKKRNKFETFMCNGCNNNRFNNNNGSTIAHLLSQYTNIDTSTMSELLHVIHSEQDYPQLFSFIFDAYSLIRYHQIMKLELPPSDFNDILQFITKYKSYQKIIIEQYKPNTQCSNTNSFFTTLFKQYSCLFGKPMLLSPNIKIKDNMATFFSYIFGMNSAIKNYIKPEPPICPLIIDFWIIPNRTVQINADEEKEIDNDIGSIHQRLTLNKVTFLKHSCVPGDIENFTEQILHLLMDKTITNEMESNNLSRIIFIVDRRYNKKRKHGIDSLYCVLPPIKYGQMIPNASYDMLSFLQMHFTSNYLLPYASKYDKNIRANHIGSSTNLNGYMFNLSYSIFNPEIKKQKEFNNVPHELNNEEKEIYHVHYMPSELQQFLQPSCLDINEVNALWDGFINGVGEQQISKANLKIIFSTQGSTMRFSLAAMTNLFKQYFVAYNQLILSPQDTNLTDIVENCFQLNLYDSYFHLDVIEKIYQYLPGLQLSYLFKVPIASNYVQMMDILRDDCNQWEKV
eukprot:199628_1